MSDDDTKKTGLLGFALRCVIVGAVVVGVYYIISPIQQCERGWLSSYDCINKYSYLIKW